MLQTPRRYETRRYAAKKLCSSVLELETETTSRSDSQMKGNFNPQSDSPEIPYPELPSTKSSTETEWREHNKQPESQPENVKLVRSVQSPSVEGKTPNRTVSFLYHLCIGNCRYSRLI